MSGIQIILGEHWADDRAIVGRLRAHGRGEARFDFAEVLDVVDVLVDGANVGSVTRPEAVACLIRDLLSGLLRLRAGEASKVDVPFHASSWELSVQRAPDAGSRGSPRVWVTFFRGGPSPDVILHGRDVGLNDLCRTSAAAARRLAARFARLDRSLAADAFVRGLRDLAVRATGPAATPPGPPALVPVRFGSRGTDRGPSAGIPRLVFQAEATGLDLLGPALCDRTDLPSLLFRGEVGVREGGRLRPLGRGYPFLWAERLLAVARHVLAARDLRRPPATLRLQCGGHLIGVRSDEGDRLLLSFEEPASGEEPAIVGFADAESLAGAAVALAGEMRRAVLSVAPAQRRNLRIEAFGGEVRELAAWRQDLAGKALINPDPGPYRLASAGEEADAELPAPTWIGEPRRMRYVARWRLEAAGLDLASTFLCGDRLIAATPDALLAIDRDGGEAIWRVDAETPPTASASPSLHTIGARGLLRVLPGGRASLLDLADGSECWSVRLRPSASAPAVLAIGGPRAPRLIVVSEGSDASRGLVALDASSGEARWRFAARRAADDLPFHLRRAGRLLVVTCGDSAVYGLDADTGALVWRFGDGVRFARAPRVVRDVVLVAGGEPSRSDAVLYALDAFAGHLRWAQAIPGIVAGEPIVGRNVAAIAAADRIAACGARLSAFEATTGAPLWTRTLPELEHPHAWLAVDDRLIANTAAGAFALDGVTGETVWEHRPRPAHPDDVPLRLEPVLRGAALFLPRDTVHVVRPDDGEPIFRLDEAPVPDWLRVDERCHLYVAEQSGHLSAWAVATRLALVR